jgi:hypothetical protein
MISAASTPYQTNFCVPITEANVLYFSDFFRSIEMEYEKLVRLIRSGLHPHSGVGHHVWTRDPRPLQELSDGKPQVASPNKVDILETHLADMAEVWNSIVQPKSII